MSSALSYLSRADSKELQTFAIGGDKLLYLLNDSCYYVVRPSYAGYTFRIIESTLITTFGV
jgi:hypothetical protein